MNAPTADMAREAARADDGKFGTQQLAEVSGVSLAPDFPKVGPSSAATTALSHIADLSNDWHDRVQVSDSVYAAFVSTRQAGVPDESVRYLALTEHRYDYETPGYRATIIDDEGNEVGDCPLPGEVFRNGDDEVPVDFQVDTDNPLVEFLSAYGENENETSIVDVQKVLDYDWDAASARQRQAIADLATSTAPEEFVITPAVAYRTNRLATVHAVADYDIDPSEANFWAIKSAAVALESTLAETDISDDTFNEFRRARQRATNNPAGMKKFRSAIDRVSGWGEAVYGV